MDKDTPRRFFLGRGFWETLPGTDVSLGHVHRATRRAACMVKRAATSSCCARSGHPGTRKKSMINPFAEMTAALGSNSKPGNAPPLRTYRFGPVRTERVTSANFTGIEPAALSLFHTGWQRAAGVSVSPLILPSGSPQPPRARNGWPCGVADHGPGYSSNRAQDDSPRQSTQCGLSGALLSKRA